MTPVHHQIIEHPSVWRGSDIAGKQAFERKLNAAELQGFDLLLARTAHLAPHDVTREAFDYPAINKIGRAHV